MKVIIKRDQKPIEVATIHVLVGQNQYLLKQSVDGKLTITKYEGDKSEMAIYPRSGNQIEIQ